MYVSLGSVGCCPQTLNAGFVCIKKYLIIISVKQLNQPQEQVLASKGPLSCYTFVAIRFGDEQLNDCYNGTQGHTLASRDTHTHNSQKNCIT